MSIYNVDNINEENTTNDTNNDILDNLLEQCDNMLGIIDESKHGSAYQRALELDADKVKYNQKIEDNKHEIMEKLGNTSRTEEIFKKLDNKKKTKFLTLSNDPKEDIKKWKDQSDSNGIYKKIGIPMSKEYSVKRELWNGVRGGNVGTTPEEKDMKKKDNYKHIQKLINVDDNNEAKKKAIKETCLSILSIIDEL